MFSLTAGLIEFSHPLKLFADIVPSKKLFGNCKYEAVILYTIIKYRWSNKTDKQNNSCQYSVYDSFYNLFFSASDTEKHICDDHEYEHYWYYVITVHWQVHAQIFKKPETSGNAVGPGKSPYSVIYGLEIIQDRHGICCNK